MLFKNLKKNMRTYVKYAFSWLPHNLQHAARGQILEQYT